MKKFDTVFRGYDKQQVQTFLDEIIKNYEQLLRKSQQTQEDNIKLKSNIFLLIFIIAYVILACITFENIYSLLPFIAAITYMIVVWNGNELQIKKIAFLCYLFWLVYNISVLSIMGIISNIVALISTYIAYYNYKKEIV